MNVAYQDLEIIQGSTQSFELIIYEDDEQTEPADLAGFTARAQIRKRYTSPEAAASFTCSIGPITTIDTFPTGQHAITLSLSAQVSDSLVEHDYVYDVELYQEDTNGGEFVVRVLEGKIYIKPAVTR